MKLRSDKVIKLQQALVEFLSEYKGTTLAEDLLALSTVKATIEAQIVLKVQWKDND